MRILGIVAPVIVAVGLAACQSRSSENVGTSTAPAATSSQSTLSLWKSCMIDGVMDACRQVRNTF